MRIAKYLASCGIASRRKAEKLISAGLISVNNEVILDLGRQIEPGIDEVKLKDKVCEPQEKVYYLLNKPLGVTTTMSDPHAKKIISELVPEQPLVWPVGRLDKETSGLIILTNDGELTQKLTHPSFRKEKEYAVVLDRDIKPEQFTELENGITLDDGFIKPDYLETRDNKTFRITIHEGKNRIVRRIFEYFDREVIKLERIRIQTLNIDEIKTGEYRVLTSKEVQELKNV